MKSILYIIAVILLISWAIGFLGGFVTSGLIHIVLVVAVILAVINLLTGSSAGSRRL